jgi:hypothetical protein
MTLTKVHKTNDVWNAVVNSSGTGLKINEPMFGPGIRSNRDRIEKLPQIQTQIIAKLLLSF